MAYAIARKDVGKLGRRALRRQRSISGRQMTHGRTERGRGEPGHHGGPHPALRRRDAILAWSTRRSDLPSVATSLGRRMPTRRKSKWDATTRSSRIRCVRETGVGVAPQRGDAAGSGVRSTPRGHLDFLQRHTSLGYEIVCPVSATGAQPAAGVPQRRSSRASDRASWNPRCP